MMEEFWNDLLSGGESVLRSFRVETVLRSFFLMKREAFFQGCRLLRSAFRTGAGFWRSTLRTGAGF